MPLLRRFSIYLLLLLILSPWIAGAEEPYALPPLPPENWAEMIEADSFIERQSLHQEQPFAPQPCTPDAFVESLQSLGLTRGTAEGAALLEYFSQWGLPLNAYQIEFVLSAMNTIERRSYPRLRIGGDTCTLEIVALGMRYPLDERGYWDNYVFVFLQREGGPWQLTDCLTNFFSLRIVANEHTAWLLGGDLGHGTGYHVAFENWYNPQTRAIEVFYPRQGRIAYLAPFRYGIQSVTSADSGFFMDDFITVSTGLSVADNQPQRFQIDATLLEVDSLARVALYQYDPQNFSLSPYPVRRFPGVSLSTVASMLPSEWLETPHIQGSSR